MAGKKWTNNELEFLRLHYPNKSTQWVADQLGRSIGSVYSAADVHHVKKSEDYLKEHVYTVGDLPEGITHRYKKGSIPANKGQKMSDEVREKVKHTWFKKGHVPHNTTFDGYEYEVKGYIVIRVSKGNFILKHRYIWEQHHGKIPDDMIIVFKDGNKRNFDINNLEMIDRVELMNRNTIQRYPDELKAIIRLNSKLNKRIKENGKEQIK